MIYFDNAASTLPFDESLNVFAEVERNFYANPSSLHKSGKATRETIEDTRNQLFRDLGIDENFYDIIFTSNATQGNEIVLQSIIKSPNASAVISKSEHKSVEENLKILKQLGHKVYQIPSPKGFINYDLLLKTIGEDDKIKLVSLIQINNVVGSINDVYLFAKDVKKINKSIVFHSDCVQSINSGIIDFEKAKFAGVDIMTFSSHKSYSPKGLGMMVIKKGINPSLSIGGGQEKGIRAGTESVGLILAYSKSINILRKSRDEYNQRINFLYKCLEEKIKDTTTFYLLREKGREYSNAIVLLTSKKLPSEVLQRILSDNDIMVSTTSACSSNAKGQSNSKLAELGFTPLEAKNTVRISFGFYNTLDEVEKLVEVLKKIEKEF